jgi:hypothetical protein
MSSRTRGSSAPIGAEGGALLGVGVHADGDHLAAQGQCRVQGVRRELADTADGQRVFDLLCKRVT